MFLGVVTTILFDMLVPALGVLGYQELKKLPTSRLF